MRIVRDPAGIAEAWELECCRRAREMRSLLPFETVTLVEVGCGRGQLTVPLVRKLPSAQVDVIDRFEGPYSSDREQLVEKLRSAKLIDRVRILSGDATRVLRRQPSGSMYAVVPSDFLSELTASTVLPFFESCHRTVREGGMTIHAFLSPAPRNEGQKLTIEADSDPRWTNHPPADWFSPPPEAVQSSLIKAGFAGVRVLVRRSCLRFVGPAAKAQLKDWEVRDTFYRDHETLL